MSHKAFITGFVYLIAVGSNLTFIFETENCYVHLPETVYSYKKESLLQLCNGGWQWYRVWWCFNIPCRNCQGSRHNL